MTDECKLVASELTMPSSTSSEMNLAECRPQKELVYNRFLPYASELDAESRVMLAEIKANLGRAVMLREFKPGCIFWLHRLSMYIKLYGLKFSKEDHIAFVKLSYQLITVPNLDPDLMYSACVILNLLLKKKKLISPDELELPWRPLYDILARHLHLDLLKMNPLPEFLRSEFECTVVYVKNYFPLNATQEILDELRPKLCPFSESLLQSLKILNLILPLQLPPRHHPIGHQLWFDELMTLWKVCHNGSTWENTMLYLIAELAAWNIGYIDWEPHIPLMFTRFIRYLELPVTYKRIRNDPIFHKVEMTSITRWIVATLGNGSSTQVYLEKFLKTIETYFYSANFGKWMQKLNELLVELPRHFNSRLRVERYVKKTWETPIPDNYKLTDSDVDAFVKCMLPVTMTAMFNMSCIKDTHQALQYLATMRPSLVIPDVFKRMQSAFDSPTQPHKLTASIICMEAVARPMVQGSRNINKGYVYSEGPTHVVQLLLSLLPGIDANDSRKTFATLRFITGYATLISIVDSSKSTSVMTEEERTVCETTLYFEDFILQFLDRVFTFIESSSSENVLENRSDNSKDKLESIAEKLLSSVCMSLLRQMSDTIFKSALRKLYTLMMERIPETKVAGQLTAVVYNSFSRFNGRETLRVLLPVLVKRILSLVNDEDVLKEENLDHRLLHAMRILSAIVDTPGNNLILHMDTLFDVLDRVLLLRSTDGNRLACFLLKRILTSLSTITPWQCRSSERDYNDPNYPYFKEWGQGADLDNFHINWYIPGEEEIAVVQRIFLKYLTVEIDKLNSYCKNTSILSREELLASLNTVSSIVKGSASVLPVWTEAPLELVKSSVKCSMSTTCTCGIKGYVTMPDGSNVRRYLVEIMSQVQQAMLKNAEDDIKSFFGLIQIWTSLLLRKTKWRKWHEWHKIFGKLKTQFDDKLVGNKNDIALVVIARCILQHEFRLNSQSTTTVALTETHKRIILQLFTLAVSRYANVRFKAQASLFSTFENFPYSSTLILPDLIEILGKDTEKYHDAYKGVLYILLGLRNNPIVDREREFNIASLLMPAIVLSKPSEKLSVIRLKENIVNSIKRTFNLCTLKLEISDACLIAARALWQHSPQPALPQPDENEIEEGARKLEELNESNLAAYYKLLDELLRCILEESLHWRHRLMVMNFIKKLVHLEHAYPAKLVRYFSQALIHESLEERKIAIHIVGFMLKQQKRKHVKVTVDVRSLSKREEESAPEEEKSQSAIVPGMRADNSWLQYNYATRPLTAQQWDESRYVHQLHIGYYAWPKIVEVYAPSSQQPCLDPEIRELTDCEKEIHSFFDDPHNIEKLINYFSLEEKIQGFNVPRYLLFKGLFRNHGIVHLKHFLPHLQRLVTDKHKSSQLCAAEITSGIIRGAKHWPFQMTCDLWQALLPVVRTAVENIVTETVPGWAYCFKIIQKNRDPNRCHWLLECLMEEPPLKDSVEECGRLYLLQSILNLHTWRITELKQRLLTRLENRLLTSPFQNVRHGLALVLSYTIFYTDLRTPYHATDSATPRMQTLIDKIVPRLQQLVKNINDVMIKPSLKENLLKKVADISVDEPKRAIEPTRSETEQQEMLIRLLKTVCKWIKYSLYRSNYSTKLGFYEIFPIVCQLENWEADEELKTLCLNTSARLAHAFVLPEDMSVILATVKMVSELSSWSARFNSLEFLKVFVFHNMGIILSNVSWINSVEDIVLRLLEDDCLEVREKAGQVLGGLLHCTFITDQEKLLEVFKRKAKTRLQTRNNSSDQHASKETFKSDAIRIRHGAVLGLCAFINAHPYDIPKYVPSIFECLSLHMNDPPPIPVAIKDTLNDFKRTHYDDFTGIRGHAQCLTEEQLAILDDLAAPPSYYA